MARTAGQSGGDIEDVSTMANVYSGPSGERLVPSPTDVAPPLDGGRYRLVDRLGAGGMAVVYRAWDARLRVWRAIKVLGPAASVHAGLRRRFETEAQTMARLRHHN